MIESHICKRGGLDCLTWFSAGAKSHSEGPWASTGGTPPSETTLPCATFNYCCTSIVYYSTLPLTQSHWEYGKEQYPLVSTAPRVGGGGVGQPPAVSICQSWELESEYISILQSPTISTTITNHNINFISRRKQHLSNANMAEWNQVSGHWPYRGTWRWLSLMWPGQLFRHTLILSFFSTAIALDWTGQPATIVSHNFKGHRTRGRAGWLISIHQGQDLDPIALLDIQLTIEPGPSLQHCIEPTLKYGHYVSTGLDIAF